MMKRIPKVAVADSNAACWRAVFLFCMGIFFSFSSEAQTNEVAVKEFVRQRGFHGFPYEAAMRFGKNEVPILLDMLKNPNEQQAWNYVVLTLGVIGDEQAVQPLIDFFERDSLGEIENTHFNALLAVPESLGHLGSGGNPTALDFLTTNATPTTWSTKRLLWSYNDRRGESFKDTLKKPNVLGL